MPDAQLHFPKSDVKPYRESWEGVRGAVRQGGQGDVKHWAFNDPLPRRGRYRHEHCRRPLVRTRTSLRYLVRSAGMTVSHVQQCYIEQVAYR